MDKTLVFRHLKDINEYIKLPQDAAAGVEALVNVIASDPDFEKKLDAIEARALAARDNSPDPLSRLAAEKGVDREMLLLTAVELFSIGMKRRWIEKGWDMDVYYDSLLDVTIWEKVCRERTGRPGLLEYGWLFGTILGQVVRLGRLQFERITVAPEDDGVTVGGVTLHTGESVINIHIPEGDPITTEKRLDAYRRAYRFFGLSGQAVFTCHSWLLYEKHYDFLPAGSNLISFMNDFKLISADTTPGNDDMWRLFGTAWQNGMRDYGKLPQDTSLRRAYVRHFKEGGTGGMSKGFFVFDGEKIVKE